MSLSNSASGCLCSTAGYPAIKNRLLVSVIEVAGFVKGLRKGELPSTLNDQDLLLLDIGHIDPSRGLVHSQAKVVGDGSSGDDGD
jgi:hypothetical protein